MEPQVNASSVCVIGAGLSGLASLKCMLDAGFKVKCFEKENHIAGMWNLKSEDCVPYNTITNVPHVYSGFSDFPLPKDFSYYMTAPEYCRYFQLYAEHFKLLDHIRLCCEIIKAEPIYQSGENGNNHIKRWRVLYRNKDAKELSEEFDFLVVATGFYTVPFIPDVVQMAVKSFKGVVKHSLHYKDWKEFENQRVVVCGLGSSGGDVACDLSNNTSQTYVASSHGAYIFGRFLLSGKTPLQLISERFSILQYAPVFISKWLHSKLANLVYNHDDLRITPKNYNSVTFNDGLCMRVYSGKIIVQPGIKKTEGKTVYFSNDTVVENIDAIILCTGFTRHFPFFDETLIQLKKNGKYLPTYKGVFSPKLHDRLAFVGFDAVLGASAITSEMEARYAAEVFKGNIILPSRDQMQEYVDEKFKGLQEDFGDDVKEYNFVSNCWKYYDELALDIGCQPSLMYLLLTDPWLAWNMVGRYSCHEYRLIGPNKWSGARDAILNEPKRLYAFMKGSREIERKK